MKEHAAERHIRAVQGAQPLTLVDLGAANGLPPHLSPLENIAEIILFEPNEAEARQLASRHAAEGRRNIRVFPYAISGSGGPRTLYLTNTPTGSSLLRPDPAAVEEAGDPHYMYPLREVTVQTRTLASVLDEEKVTNIDALKLDVQGAEFEVLRGLGEDYLKKVLSIELEIGMPGVYEGQPGYSDIDRFLRERGFRLFDLRPARFHRHVESDADYYPRLLGVHRNSPTLTKRIWEVDAVYFRESAPLFAGKDIAALRRLATLQCVYGFFPEALHLAITAEEAGVLSADQTRELMHDVLTWHRRRQYAFIYGRRWHFILRALRKLLVRLIRGRHDPRWIED